VRRDALSELPTELAGVKATDSKANNSP